MDEKIPENKMQEKLEVHGYTVIYDENSRIGVDYLYGLSYEEATKIFERAAADGSTVFQDKNGYGYKLTCKYEDSTYTIEKKY